MISSPLRLCTAIAWLAFAADASPFGVPSRISSPSRPRAHRAASSIIQRLRAGGPTDDDNADADAVSPAASRPHLPYTLAIRDSIMIAHSFHGHPSFGPAGGLHGATYTVDVEFASSDLHPVCNWVIDIGIASELLAGVLTRYNYKNLDEVFGDGVMTTTEFMCRAIFDGVVERLKDRNDDFKGWIKVSLWESHKAWASFEGPAN